MPSSIAASSCPSNSLSSVTGLTLGSQLTVLPSASFWPCSFLEITAGNCCGHASRSNTIWPTKLMGYFRNILKRGRSLTKLAELRAISRSNICRRTTGGGRSRTCFQHSVVDGAHSVTGKPLLANDPHLDYAAPIIWYLARLSRRPNLTLVGATMAGGPLVILGHNGQIAGVNDPPMQTPRGRAC